MDGRARSRILIVDDEEDFCRFIKMYLEATGGFEVSVCCDSTKAIAHVREQNPDLILLDIMMPGVSGPEIAERLRGDVTTRSIPFVFLTAVATEEDIETRGNVIGGNYTVAKPVKAAKLMNVIEEALGL